MFGCILCLSAGRDLGLLATFSMSNEKNFLSDKLAIHSTSISQTIGSTYTNQRYIQLEKSYLLVKDKSTVSCRSFYVYKWTSSSFIKTAKGILLERSYSLYRRSSIWHGGYIVDKQLQKDNHGEELEESWGRAGRTNLRKVRRLCYSKAAVLCGNVVGNVVVNSWVIKQLSIETGKLTCCLVTI